MSNSDRESAVHSGNENDVDLLYLLNVLGRYKWLIIVITAVSAIGILFFAVLSLKLPPERSPLPNLYKPSALILINEESGTEAASLLASSGLGSLASLAGVSTGSSYGALASKIVRSKSTLDLIANEFEVADKYKIGESPVGKSRSAIDNRLGVVFDGDTSTLTISYEDYDPVYARDIVNRIVEILAQRFSAIGGNKNLTRKNLLEQKLAEVEVEIARYEAQIQAFQEEQGALDVESLAREQVSALAELKSQLILKDMEIKTYSGFTSIDDPIMKRMRAERENLARLIEEMESGYSEYEALMPAQDDLPALAIEFEHLKRNLQIQASIYQILTQQYELAKLNVEGEEQIFQTLELADVPDLKSGPRRSYLCAGVTAGAFFFSIILSFLLNALKNIKNDPERMKKLRGE